MAKTHQYKAGDKLRRIGKDWHNVKVGDVVMVADALDHAITLLGHGHLRFDPAYFEMVERKPLPKAPVLPGAFNAEADPNGRAANAPGAKLDAGKVMPSLIIEGMARAIWAVSEVATFGANKYTKDGWVEVPDGQARYADAGYRHILKRAKGELVDPDSEKLHLAHEAWNALAKLDLYIREQESK